MKTILPVVPYLFIEKASIFKRIWNSNFGNNIVPHDVNIPEAVGCLLLES